MEYVFIPLDKIKIVEKFIDDYPIYLDFKSFVKNKDEKLYKKLPLYLVCEEKIINNKRILTDLLTSNDLSFYLYGEYKEGLLVAECYTHIKKEELSVIYNYKELTNEELETFKKLINDFSIKSEVKDIKNNLKRIKK